MLHAWRAGIDGRHVGCTGQVFCSIKKWVGELLEGIFLGLCRARGCKYCLSIHLCGCMHRKITFVTVGGRTHMPTFTHTVLTCSLVLAFICGHHCCCCLHRLCFTTAASAATSAAAAAGTAAAAFAAPVVAAALAAAAGTALAAATAVAAAAAALCLILVLLHLLLICSSVRCCFPADQARAVVVRPKGRAPRDPPPCWRAAAA